MSAKLKIISSMLIWGSMGLFVKNIDLSADQIALFRGVIGVFFLLGVSLVWKMYISQTELLRNKKLLIASGVALGTNWIFLFEAYKHTTIAIATLSYYLAPIIVVALSSLILNEKLTHIKVLCMGTALTGLGFVSGMLPSAHQSTGSGLGILYGLAAAVSYASITLMNKFIKGPTSIETTVAQLGIASMVLLPYTLFTSSFIGIIVDGQSVLLLLTLGMIHTGLGFWLFFSAINSLRAQTIAVLSYIDPVTAIVLSTLLLKEEISSVQLVGAGLILGATFISEVSDTYFQSQS